MKTYTNLEQVKADIKDDRLYVEDDIKIDFDGFSINADIHCRNIYAEDRDIIAWDIKALDIKARDIDAGDIGAWDIDAKDISYYAVCLAYNSISCTSIKGTRPNSKHFVLDGEITIRPKHVITIDGKEIELSEESFNNLKQQLVD